MKKFAIPAVMAVIITIFLSTPALASAMPDNIALPLNTASPRDWTKYAPGGQLDPGKIVADSAILIDARTGKVLFAKDENTPRYPASTTKIMTCLLALENCKDLSTLVTIGTLPHTDFINQAENIDLKKTETISMEQLLYGLMVYSGNDAADAIAQYIGNGSITNFVDMMNQKAHDLGMNNTHYTDTNGLANDPNHHTTAADMAKLAAAAIKYPEFVKIVSTYQYTMPPTNMHSKSRVWVNTNYLIRDVPGNIYSYQYATGIKTGYTSMAGNALVSSAQNGDVSLISVVLHDTPRKNIWTDSTTMFQYGFQFYDTLDLLQLMNNQSFSVDINNAAGNDPGAGKLNLSLKPQSTKAFITDTKDVVDNIKNNAASLITSKVVYTKDTAPIKQDEVVGTITFSYNNSPVLTCDLIAQRDVAEMPTPAPQTSSTANSGSTASVTPAPGQTPGATAQTGKKSGGFGSVLVWLGVIFAVLVLAMLSIRLVNVQRRNRKYRQYNYRQGNGTKLRR